MTIWSEQIADGAVLLTVNQRLARHHLVSYQAWQCAAGNLWWESPDILPLKAWLSRVHADALAAGIVTDALVPDILAQRAWRRCVEQDAAATLLDTEAAASLAKQTWQLACSWRCYNDEDRYLSADQFTFQRWLQRYRQWLSSESLVDAAMLADVLTDVLTDILAEQQRLPQMQALLPESIILDGFLQLTPQLAELFNAMQSAGVSIVYSSRQSNAMVETLEFADEASELSGIATQMRAELERDECQSLGLVIPDLQQRRAAVVRTFDRVFFPGQSPDQIRSIGRPYDLSLGSSLSDQAVITSALNLLDLCHQSVSGASISSLLLSPHWEAAESESRRRQQLDTRLRDRRIRTLSLQTFANCLYPGSKLARPVARLLKTRQLGATTLSGWALRFAEWLNVLGWPGQGKDSEEYQSVLAWLECLDDMQILDDGERLKSHEALQQLRTLTRDRVFQPESPSTPIQIMGRLESHGIGFDCLWIAGLDDEQWPASATPNPFLDISRQKACGIPESAASTRLELAEQEFHLWASQAPVLIACHAAAREGKTLQAARLPAIQASAQQRDSAEKYVSRLRCVHNQDVLDPIRLVSRALELEELPDHYGPALPAGVELPGGARLFENQALCPFRAFALHRLAIRPLEEPGLGLDARQHGTVLHAALESFWKKIKTHADLLQLPEPELNQIISSVVAVAIADAIEDVELPESLRALEHQRLCRLITDWIVGCEMPREPFEVQSLEQKQSIEHGGVIMKVVLDRIDSVDGALVVVDYKTGTSNRVSTWADKRIVNPQLPLYVLTDEAITAASFAQVASNQCKFIGIASDPALLPGVKSTVRFSDSANPDGYPLDNWPAWRAHWKSALDEVAAELRQGLATVTPMKGACKFCELKPVCRVSEQIVDVAGELPATEEHAAAVIASDAGDWP